jgi:mannose/cellobiose epimerase-like protein (N-acyl-D-glucosamine 2-epimerase family)/ABC-type transporter Mla MlaB component
LNNVDFTFSDLVMGYVERFDADRDVIAVRTSDGRPYELTIAPDAYAEVLRNLGEPYKDATAQLRGLLSPGRLLFAYGTFMPTDNGTRFDAKHFVLPGPEAGEYLFERRSWWVAQVDQLADFYLRAEFGDGIDFRNYRTSLTLEGTRENNGRQECDTISRLVYGFASAFLLTGKDAYLEAAEAGTTYLREHFRWQDPGEGISYWYHAVDIEGAGERKILASEFGDDLNAIPAYEQIYALAGPTQTMRATGDPQVLADIRSTIELFNRHFLDRDKGGYFSHIDPITFDPRSESLGKDQARKNWNSVGDHAPAYLINAWLATGDDSLLDMLAMTADTIAGHFPDEPASPFVNERFYEDWSKDQAWGWQHNRAVVGHNLKIAWNLMRIHNARPSDSYRDLARRIGSLMPAAGSDQQRGGWYDVVERTKGEGERFHAFAFHDRKAWWQQEQAILAYLILAGAAGSSPHGDGDGDQDWLRLAREASAFYNAWFLDHDAGGVYFNVLANGTPYLLGNERLKGSHSMAGYHSFELCYLAATYTNLLITKEPLDLYFKPLPGALPGNVLRVSPDILPEGSVEIGRVWIDGEPWEQFDPKALTVTLPELDRRPKVRVELVPATGVEHFDAQLVLDGRQATLRLSGSLDTRAVPTLREALGRLQEAQPARLRVELAEVSQIHPAGIRALVFACQKLPLDEDVTFNGATGDVATALDQADLTGALRRA